MKVFVKLSRCKIWTAQPKYGTKSLFSLVFFLSFSQISPLLKANFLKHEFKLWGNLFLIAFNFFFYLAILIDSFKNHKLCKVFTGCDNKQFVITIFFKCVYMNESDCFDEKQQQINKKKNTLIIINSVQNSWKNIHRYRIQWTP